MARRRQRIIEAATAVLTERGPAALPLDEIAERAGVSRRTVFNYFHSVEDLLVAVGADMLGGVIASLQVNAPAPSEVPDPHEAPPEAPQEALLDELARILQSADLVAATEAHPVRLTLNGEVIACGIQPRLPVQPETATPIATGKAIRSARNEVMSVPTIGPAAP